VGPRNSSSGYDESESEDSASPSGASAENPRGSHASSSRVSPGRKGSPRPAANKSPAAKPKKRKKAGRPATAKPKQRKKPGRKPKQAVPPPATTVGRGPVAAAPASAIASAIAAADSQHPRMAGPRGHLVASPREPESKYHIDEADDTLQVDDFVLAYDEDENCHRPVRIVSVDHAGPRPTYETRIYGTYNPKGLHKSKYLPAYVDPKDGKLLFTAKPKPRHEPWRWQVHAADVCSMHFVLKRFKVPQRVHACRRRHQ
jgi:hypothetical protein